MPLNNTQKDWSSIEDIIKEPTQKSFGKTGVSKLSNPDNRWNKIESIINNEDDSTGINPQEAAVTNPEFAATPITEDSVVKQADKASGFIGSMAYLSKSAGSGLSMGIFPNEDETDSTLLKVSGVIVNGLATLASGLLLPEIAVAGKIAQAAGAASKIFKAEKAIAPFFKAGTEEVVASLGKKAATETAKRVGATVANAATTGAVYGGAVEGIKSVRAGDDTEDTLTNILVGATGGAAFGAVLGAGVEGISTLVGNRTVGKVTQNIKTSLEKPGVVDLVELQTSIANKDAKAYIAANAEKFNKKIKDINPVLAPWELAARPELLRKDLQETLKPMAEKLFLDPAGAGNVLYQQNESLKKLVDSGDYAGALSVYTATSRTQIKSNSYLKDYIKEPFLMDSKVLPEIMADSLLSKKGMQGFRADRQKLVNYFSDPKDQTNIDELLLIKDPTKKKSKVAAYKSYTFNNKYNFNKSMNEIANMDMGNGKGRFTYHPGLSDIGNIVADKVKSTNLDDILNFYKNKYSLKNLSLKVENRKFGGGEKGYLESFQKNGELFGEIKIFKSKDNPMEDIGTLRHEIEHFRDVSEGYIGKPVNVNRIKNYNFDKLTYKEALKKMTAGHHGLSDNFEYNYLTDNFIPYAFENKKNWNYLKNTVNGNIRLGSLEVDDLVSKRLTELYKTVADGKINAENALILQDYDSILKSMITFNKPLTRTVAESFVRNQTFDDVIGTVSAEDMPLVKKLVDKRVDQLNIVRLSKQRTGLLADFKIAQNQADKESIGKELQNNLRKLYRTQARIDEATSALSSRTIAPEELNRLNGVADSVYIPSIENVSKKLSQDVKAQIGYKEGDKPRSRLIKDYIFNRDNPKFIKDMTDLTDIVQAMDNAGYDVDLAKSGPMNLLSNIQRKTLKEFGRNNIFQTAIFDKIKTIDMESLAYKNKILKDLKTQVPEFKPGSTVSNMLPDFMEGKFSVTDDVFTSLPAKDQDALIRTSKMVRSILDDVHNDMNVVLSKNNELLIAKKENYFPWKDDPVSLFKEKLKRKFSGEADPTTYNGIAGEQVQYSKNKITAGFMRQKTGLSEAKGIKRLDAYETLTRYLGEASNIIHATDMAKSLDSVANFAPTKLAKSLRHINEKYVIKLPDESMNTVGGKVFGEMRRRMANSLLVGTASVAAQQMLSIPTSAAIGGKEALAAMWKRFTPEIKSALSQSTNLALRDIKNEGYELGRAMIRPLLRRVGGKAGKAAAAGFDTYEGTMGFLLKAFDKEAAAHAFTTGYLKATKLGLESKDAIRYADMFTGMIQGEMTKLGQPEFMGNVYGRTLSQFMSYSMNLFSTLKDDLPMIARSDGAIKAMQMIARTYVGMTLTNEVLRDNGLPEQFDVGAFFPFHDGNRMMIPGAYGVIANSLFTGKNALEGQLKDSKKKSALNWTGKQGTNYLSSTSLKKFESDVVNMLGIPGLGQAQKSIRATEAKGFEKLKPDRKMKAIVFGKKSLSGQSSKDRQKEFKNKPFNKKVKKILFR